LVIGSIGRLRTALRSAGTNPYILFAAVYTLLFAVAFASLSNFGNLSRQRVQVYPFLLVLLALPAIRVAGRKGAPRLRSRPDWAGRTTPSLPPEQPSEGEIGVALGRARLQTFVRAD
jgi:hypothetical protein